MSEVGVPDREDFDEPDAFELHDQSGTPCVECGATGACAWDLEGRALIHAIRLEED